MSWHARLASAALSAVLAWWAGSAAWPLSARALAQGAIFGALVLVPFLPAGPGRGVRAAALVAGGMIIQLLALSLARHLLALMPLSWAITAAGVCGALLVALLAQAVIPLRAPWPLWPVAAAAGLVGGLLLGFPGVLPGGRLPGLIAWQTLLWAALHGSPRHRPGCA